MGAPDAEGASGAVFTGVGERYRARVSSRAGFSAEGVAICGLAEMRNLTGC